MLSVNFVDRDPNLTARRKTRVFACIFALTIGILATAGAAASYRSVNRGTNVWTEFGRLPVISDIGRAMGVAPGPTTGLSTKKDDQYLNILILGIGGAGHDGSLLTDTILFASIDQKEKKVGMVSIPRDFAFPLETGGYEKINAVHAYAEQDNPGRGAVITAEAFSRYFEVPIDHVIRLDFRGFASLINNLGGIEVTVERSFVDKEYPAPEDLFTTVSFKKGTQTMDGETALTFVRSRHGSNGEGSDFARSRRQQIVMLAIRQKLLSLKTLADPSKLAKLYTTLTSHIQTDLTPWDAIRFAPLAEEISSDRVTSHVITDAPGGVLETGYWGDVYMLFPRRKNVEPIRALLQNPFQTPDEFATNHAPPPALAKAEIRNGTFVTGLAALASDRLDDIRIDTAAIGNAGKRTYKRTVVYDLTDGKKADILAELRKTLDADLSLTKLSTTTSGQRLVYTDGLVTERVSSGDIDFFVILGENAQSVLAAN